MKEKANNSCIRQKDFLIQDFKEYAEYAFPNNALHHPQCEDAVDSVNCNICSSIFLPDIVFDKSEQAPIITFSTYMTQSACLYNGILLLEKKNSQCMGSCTPRHRHMRQGGTMWGQTGSPPELHDKDSKHMCVDAMTKKEKLALLKS
eukprot:10509497-Ditylum_brightwellii.AAC.1